MPNRKMIYKKWTFRCLNGHKFTNMQWDYEPIPSCPECGQLGEGDIHIVNQAPGVISDEIDVEVKHGLCHPDGTPKRYTSMTELRRDASEKGWVISGETPNLTQKQRDEVYLEKERLRKKWS